LNPRTYTEGDEGYRVGETFDATMTGLQEALGVTDVDSLPEGDRDAAIAQFAAALIAFGTKKQD
jgi:hypothetical protein